MTSGFQRRRVTLAVIIVLVFSMLTACATAADPTPAPATVTTDNPAVTTAPPSTATAPPPPSNFNETGFPIVNEPVTLKVMSITSAANGPWEDMTLFKAMEELTNVHFEFNLTLEDAWEEQKNLAFVSNDLPDVFFRGITLKDEVLYGTQGKSLIDLTPYIDAYMPNMQAAMELYPGTRQAITALDGNIYMMPYLVDTYGVAAVTNYVRGDWLAKAGLERPKTIDEYYEMLVAFKGLGDGIIPASFSEVNVLLTCLIGAFGEEAEDLWAADDNGKVIYMPATEQYERTVAFLNKLYSEKLLDQETFTQSGDQANAKVVENKVGNTDYGTRLTTANFESGHVETIMLAPLVSEYSSTQKVKGVNYISLNRGSVTKACENPEVWARWVDCFFSEEEFAPGLSGLSSWFGIRGETWDYTTPEKTMVERKVLTATDLTPDAWARYFVAPHSGFIPCYLNYKVLDPNYDLNMKGLESIDNYFPYAENPPFPINFLRYTEEEQSAIGTIEADIKEFLATARAEFITGTKPMSDYSNFVSELNKMGLDKLVAQKQAAYDRYLAAQ